MLNDVEVWEVYNATMDAHPVHLHLVTFQILSRESFDGFVEEKPQPQHSGGVGVGGKLTVTALGGDARGPAQNESGWKDTAVMLPGEVTRLIAKFDRPGEYAWHCHILSHEDHEMMRRFHVGPMTLAKGETDSKPEMSGGPSADGRTPMATTLSQNHPNPFNPMTEIRFALAETGDVKLMVYTIAGQEIRTLSAGELPAGEYAVTWDGKDNLGNPVSSGVYFYQLRAGAFTETKKMTILR